MSKLQVRGRAITQCHTFCLKGLVFILFLLAEWAGKAVDVRVLLVSTVHAQEYVHWYT